MLFQRNSEAKEVLISGYKLGYTMQSTSTFSAAPGLQRRSLLLCRESEHYYSGILLMLVSFQKLYSVGTCYTHQ